MEAVNEADIEAALDEPRSIASLRSEASEAEEEASREVAALAKAEAARFEAEERAAAAQLEKRLEEAAALSERLAAAEDANGEGASAPVETGGEAVAPAAPNDKELEDLFA